MSLTYTVSQYLLGMIFNSYYEKKLYLESVRDHTRYDFLDNYYKSQQIG